MREVFDQADHAEHRRRIDVFAERFVVEADIAAGDRRAEGDAGFASCHRPLR